MSTQKQTVRRLPVGAEGGAGGTHFRVWAPAVARVRVVIEDALEVELDRESDGYHAGFSGSAVPGSRYRLRLDGHGLYPDPVSRYQPEGPHGPSVVVDASAFAWTDSAWRGLTARGQVIYELHIGTFTPEGTWRAAEEHLRELADLGITAIEVMPVAEFPGAFGWGYDGVDLFAPSHLYGAPDDFRRFVNRAHAEGLGVILDVVYNHVGSEGNFLSRFSRDYFTDRYSCEWGEAINFDGESSEPVREFYIANACYWIEEFHIDGLRFDATQAIYDSSRTHILEAIQSAVRKKAAPRSLYLAAESEPQEARIARPVDSGGFGLDALWNDDFHHTARVALTGNREAYFSGHAGTPQELISAVRWGYLYQGQYYTWQAKRRGTAALDLPPTAFVSYLENHDQVANGGTGRRLCELAHPGRHRAMTALLLLSPATPLLFQGQEYGSRRPFVFFADMPEGLRDIVAAGRARFLHQFPSLRQFVPPDPGDARTFRLCTLDRREASPEAVALHRDLLALRKEPALAVESADGLQGAVLGDRLFLLRFMQGPRLLIVNLETDAKLGHVPEPLISPLDGAEWQVEWSSEDSRYGGRGVAPLWSGGSLFLPGPAAILLQPAPRDDS